MHEGRSLSRRTACATALVALFGLLPLVSLAGCNLFAPAVPCHVDENCAPGERCREGACAVAAPRPHDAGALRDAGPGDDDAGADAGDPGPPCSLRVVVTAGAAAVPAGHPVRLALDHAALVALGYRPDGSDLHVVHDDGAAGTPLPRALDPLTTWNSAETALWFPLAAALEAGATTSAYLLRSDATTAPSADERQVFPVADFFERPDATPLEPPWVVPYGGAAVIAGALEVEAPNLPNRPLIDLALPPQTTTFDLVLGWGFARTGAENEYRLHLHLGDADAMTEPPELETHFAADGASVSLVWAGANEGLASEEMMAAHVPGGYTPLEVVSGQHELVVRTDPAADRYDVIVDGEVIGATLPFLVAGDVVSRFRIVEWQLGTAIEERRLEYVYLLPRLAEEPTLGVELLPECE